MKSRWTVLLPAALLFLACSLSAATQSGQDLTDLRKDIETLKAGQEAIAHQLEELKVLLQARPAAAPVTAPLPAEIVLDIQGAPAMGDKNARVVLVEFLDYQCPFCARHYRETLPQLQKNYIATGKVRYLARHYPLEALHPESFKAHEASRCADEQGKFWEMHARLLAYQQALSREDLVSNAKLLKLDETAFRVCLDSGRQAPAVRKDLEQGAAAGVTGTPSFFLGLAEPGAAELLVLRRINGAQAFAAFSAEIDNLLKTGK